MRSLLLLFLCFIIRFSASSQDLSGEWEGEYTFFIQRTPIKLSISRNSDSSYTILSYTNHKTQEGKDSIDVCKVSYKKISNRSIQLEEYEYISGKKNLSAFQRMFLKIQEKRGTLKLVGRWENANQSSFGNGDIFFVKKK